MITMAKVEVSENKLNEHKNLFQILLFLHPLKRN
jgi:hypothetical protein